MREKIPAFVFKNRRFVSIAIFTVAMVLKFFLGGSTTLPLLIVGLIVVALGMALRVCCAGYLLGRHIVRKVGSEFLCTSGPFAYVRNPLYLGNFVVGMGVCISLNEWYAYAIFVVGYVCLYSIIIPYEERFLQEKFGSAYADYRAHTRRFVPGLKGYRGSTKLRPDYKLGAASEMLYLVILVTAFVIFHVSFVR